MTRDRIDLGALVKAYSSPVMLARISDTATRTKEGVCTHTERSTKGISSQVAARVPQADRL